MKYHHQFLGTVQLATPERYTLEEAIRDFGPDTFLAVIDSSGERTTARARTLTPIEETPPASTGSLNDLADEILAINVSKGFSVPGEDPNIDRMLLLAVGELIEAQDELRAGRAVDEVYYAPVKLPASLVAEVGVAEAERLMAEENKDKLQKPEGFVVELADTIIRVLHMAARLGLDIDKAVAEKLAYNKTRPFKHGKKF